MASPAKLIESSTDPTLLQHINGWRIGQVSEASTPAQIIDGVFPDASHFTDLNVAVPHKMEAPHFSRDFVCEFGVHHPFAKTRRLASFASDRWSGFPAAFDAVRRVVFCATPANVTRVAAKRVIAGMKGEWLPGRWPPMLEEARYA